MSHRVESWRFRQHPLIRGGHLQTVLGIYLPWRGTPYAAARHQTPVDDSPLAGQTDYVVLHEDRPAAWQPPSPVVLLIHGLAGSYRSTYLQRTAERLFARGHCVVRMDLRGCGAGRGLACGATHCGRSGDVAAAIRRLAHLFPQSPLLVIGFSLSGALMLNMLADAGDERIGNFARGLAVCPPIDLFDVERRFNSRGGRLYDRFFAKRIWEQVLDRWRLYPELAPSRIPRRPRRLRHIDEAVIAPAAGFNSAEEYYAATQAGPRLARITQPVTILAADDDPIVPTAPLGNYTLGPGVTPLVVPGGGHLGFVSRGAGDPDNRWLDWRIVEWVERGVMSVPHFRPRSPWRTAAGVNC